MRLRSPGHEAWRHQRSGPMHLKRVEMKNFKSFRDADVPFQEGFTGITGPNGSGKSNISDAILFVLGTSSSKAIRAGRLADLIHNGGTDGKPRDECKVSLLFDNTDRTIPLDEDEIRLTRRLKRSPSDPDRVNSYYYVNGDSSTLTEFEDLLSHARISADGYNIVQQGDVTRIVTMSNTERRKILDEIAGITRFDGEINDAERQRDEVEENLERTRLILREVNQHLKQLTKEKDRAARYRKLQDELETVKGKLAKKQVYGLVQELNNVHASIESYQEEGTKLEIERTTAIEEINEVEQRLEDLDEKMAELGGEDAKKRQQELQSLKEDLATARQMANHFKNEVQEVKIDLNEAQADHAQAEDNLKGILEEKQEVQDALSSWRDEAETLTEDLEATKAKISEGSERSQELQRSLAKLKQRYESAQDDRHEAHLHKESLEERLERIEAEHLETEEALETAKFETKDLRWAAKEAKKEHEALKEEKDQIQQELFEAKKAQADLNKAIQDLEPEIRELRNKYTQRKAEFEAAANVGGFSRAVEAILEARDTGTLEGIHGTIAELGEPPEDLETALEICAGGAMQAVIVEDDQVASEAIQYLKKNKLGRVKFLPLNKLSYRRPQGKALMASRDDRAIGFAVDLIDYDEAYKPAFSYVFRSTLIVENLEAARQLMGGVRLVTKNGELIDAGGAMTGGSIRKRKRAGFNVQRKDQLEELGKKLRAKVTEKETLEAQERQRADEVRQHREKVRELESELVKQETKHNEAKRQAEDANARIESLEETLDALQERLEKTQTDLEEATHAFETADEELERLEAKRDEKSEALMQSTQQALADKLETLREERESIRDTLSEFEARREALEEKERIARERRDEIAQRVVELEAKRDEHKAEIEGYQAKQENLQEEINVLEELVNEHDAQVQDVREEREKWLEKKYQLENKRDRIQDNIDANQDLVVQFKGRIPVIESNLEEAQNELDAMEVDIPEDVPESQQELKKESSRLEGAMTRLEPVNMRALEEYEEQEKRKDELEDELERLERERESLIELTEELIGRKKDALMTVFEEVNENFQETFKKLSGGGEARLELENAVDPFEGGLILKSQPHGKKVHRLEALSGGEKSLTALSFIFAIQRYAPSPFYVLDEVDMFLDGVNSELIAKMVRENSQRAQFIMVSLRKVTLKLADHVYGVTMRDGITQILGTVNVDDIVHTEELEAP